MAVRKDSKLVVRRAGRALMVRRARDRRWTFPGGKRKAAGESARRCLHRELKEELPELRVSRPKLHCKLWDKDRATGRRTEQAIFVAARARGRLVIGNSREIDRAEWRRPYGLRLTSAARVIRDRMFAPSRRAPRA
jgi:8-oxo-dGTP pyrophosphatase MutT (NUDIX family)